ncbi:MAG: sulfurtransferase TusE [Gammaproteobacteria bacterium]|nr:sulfurtransferase TusE [Gammaproteobacteria bacterium]
MRRKINSDLWDSEGFLKDVSLWDEEIARTAASKENIILNAEHWDIIYLLRRFYENHQIAPANRALVNLVKNELGFEKGKSIYLMNLFGGSPAKLASKISGLPRPENCF